MNSSQKDTATDQGRANPANTSQSPEKSGFKALKKPKPGPGCIVCSKCQHGWNFGGGMKLLLPTVGLSGTPCSRDGCNGQLKAPILKGKIVGYIATLISRGYAYWAEEGEEQPRRLRLTDLGKEALDTLLAEGTLPEDLRMVFVHM